MPAPLVTYHRKVIHIRAQDSPNVRLYEAERAAGKPPSYRELVPGVVSARSYRRRRRTWDKIKQCIGLEGQFWQGSEVLLYPPDWLNLSEHRAMELRDRQLAGSIRRDTKLNRGMGVDPGEGGANTAITVADAWGVLQLEAYQTPDTSDIIGMVIKQIKRWEIPHERVLLDAGGGGKQIGHQLRRMGYKVRIIAFGERVSLDPRRGMRPLEEKVENREEQYSYFNRRAQLYGGLREILDPTLCQLRGVPIFAIPPWYPVYRQQLAPIPLTLSREGVLKLLPKHKPNPGSKEKTLTELIGRSPDEVDSLVLAVHALLHVKKRFKAGVG